MNLNDIKLSHQAKNTQFIVFDSNYIIKESDNVLFLIEPNTSLTDFHPFFESIVDNITAEEFSISCVHLDIKNKILTCDVEIKPLDNNTYLLILINFSKHYESFQSLAQSRNENSIKSELLTVKNQVLKEKEAFKNKFIDNFSHEIISPITSIIAFSNLMQDSKLTHQQKEYLDVISSSSLHLKSMINDVLDISKLGIGKLEVQSEQFNLNKLLSQIESEYIYKCAQKQLDFNISIESNIPKYIESDKTKIRQLIKNLLDNAIKFTKTGHISLKVEKVFSRAQKITLAFIIQDTGSGIKKENQKNIFKRFNRLENSTHIEGVGLGLSIVEEITELLNGSIDLKSDLKKGSTFTVTIKAKCPIIQEVVQHKNSKKLFLKKKQKYQVLIVEDNELHQMTIFKFLARTNNYYLDIVSNGIEAIEAVKKSNYDIVLMDYKMPLLNGLETAKVIKNLSDTRKNSTPIIITTGAHMATELLSQKGKDITDIIAKPFDENEFVNIIENCLAK